MSPSTQIPDGDTMGFSGESSRKKIEKNRYLGQFLTLGAAERLCVDIRDVARAMRPKLVVIPPCRTIFGVIYA